MAKNDTVLIDGIIAQKLNGGIPFADKGEAFEHFSFEQILKNYDLSQDEIETGWVDGGLDGGIDGFFLFINGHLVADIQLFQWPRTNARMDLFLINCKHHDTFKESTLNTILATAQEFFDFSVDEAQLRGAYSNEILAKRRLLIEAYRRVAVANPTINLHFFYCSRGDADEIGDSVRARADQIKHASNEFFSNSHVAFTFVGSKELVERHRESKQFTLELPFQDYLSGTGEGYIAVVKLWDYYRFVCDDDENLRRYLFDSNVRDYLGDTKVNDDISASLENDSTPDFWWLNNGITVLATKAVINGKVIILQDIQVVNGLQTTETIYRHFKRGSERSRDRTLSIKIIVSRDEQLRDQIIRATNNQTLVEQAALHATDKIQRDIEEILEKHDFYYERRKNYYRNIGKPEDRFVTPLFVAAGYVAIVQKNPVAGGLIKSRFMRSEASYRSVFSDSFPIEGWVKIVAILKAAERVLQNLPRSYNSFGEKFARSWRGVVGLLFVAKTAGTFAFGNKHLLDISTASISDDLLRECWQFILAQRQGATRPTAQIVKRMCRDFAVAHSIAGLSAILQRAMRTTVQFERQVDLPAIPPNQEFLNQVDALLPKQPWPVGVHREVAEKLDVEVKQVRVAIAYLIHLGKRYDQVDGVLFDKDGNEVRLQLEG